MGIDLELWTTVTDTHQPRVDGDELEVGALLAPTVNHTTCCLSPQPLGAIQQRAGREINVLPQVFDVTEPIDIGYTWVNGRDPDRLRRMQAAKAGPNWTS